MKTIIWNSLKFVSKLFSFDEKKYLLRSFLCLPSDTPLGLVDVGAAGDIEPRWKKIETLIDYYGFEPDSRSLENLDETNSNNLSRTIYPYALWEKTEKLSINLCRKEQVSSHFTPNRDFLDKYPDKRRFDVLNKSFVESRRMDEIDIEHPDFIKIDIQGGELSVLKGSTTTLKRTFGMEIEVEFLEMYLDQPLFGEIVDFLHKFDFEFIDFVNICRWEREAHNEIGHSIFGDALFLKSPEFILDGDVNLDDQTKYLKILLLYRRFDLIEVFLTSISEHSRQNFKEFEKNIQPIKKSFNRAQLIGIWSSRLQRLFGGQYRNHLFY